MKPEPAFICPLCGKKYYTREQAMTCADADVKENIAKNRKLKLIRSTK